MALSLKDKETDRLAREVAALTGETLTDAIRKALSEPLERERLRRSQPADLAGAFARSASTAPLSPTTIHAARTKSSDMMDRVRGPLLSLRPRCGWSIPCDLQGHIFPQPVSSFHFPRRTDRRSPVTVAGAARPIISSLLHPHAAWLPLPPDDHHARPAEPAAPQN